MTPLALYQVDWVKRIHIIGGAGSGKTTLAHQLRSKSGFPVYELDKIGYEGGAGAKVPLAQKLEQIQRIANEPAWITEGIFLWWTEALFQQADRIVWLDLPARVALWRIILRHFKKSLAGNNPHPGLRNLYQFSNRQRQRFYHATNLVPSALDDDNAITRQAMASTLQPYADKLVHIRSSKALNRWLATFPPQPSVTPPTEKHRD